jgi:hypothetical protein
MTRRKQQESLPLDHVVAIPSSYTGGDDQRLVLPSADPTIGIIVIGGVPYLISNPANAVLTSVTDDGQLLRTIDGGTTPIFAKVTATKALIRFATYLLTGAGFVLARSIVRVGIRGADSTTTTGPKSIAYTKGSGTFIAQTPADGTGDGSLQAVTGTGGDLGIFEAVVTFGATTGVKTITLSFGADQYVLSVDIT